MSAERKIKVSRKLLERDRFIRWAFKRHVGVQIYLAIGSSHLRSQYFNEAIWNVVKRLEKHPVKTADELQLVFERFASGFGDGSARKPWKFQPVYEPRSFPNEDDWHKARREEAIAENKAMREKQREHFQQLLDAINGINPWIPDWIP